jgi:hypothetical protein
MGEAWIARLVQNSTDILAEACHGIPGAADACGGVITIQPCPGAVTAIKGDPRGSQKTQRRRHGNDEWHDQTTRQ